MYKYLAPRGTEGSKVRGENSQCEEAHVQGALLRCIKERGSGFGNSVLAFSIKIPNSGVTRTLDLLLDL